jgi:hypothetical protein
LELGRRIVEFEQGEQALLRKRTQALPLALELVDFGDEEE